MSDREDRSTQPWEGDSDPAGVHGPQQSPGSGYGQQPPPPPGTGYGQQPPPGPGYSQQPPPQPGSGYGQYGQYGPEQSNSPYWAAPVAQPGTIPLRALSLGEIYDGAFRSIRANLPVMLGLSAIVVLLMGIIEGLTTYGAFEDMNRLLGRLEQTTDPEAVFDDFAALGSSLLLSGGVSTLLTFLATTILTGLLIHAVSQSVIGRQTTLGQTWTAVRPQILRLIVLTVIIGLLVGAVVVAAILIITATAVTGSGAVLALGILLALVVAVVGIPTVLTLTVLATPALVLERAGIGAALARGFALARTSFWRVLGIYLLTNVLVYIVSMTIVFAANQIGMVFESAPALFVASLGGGVLANWITTPILAAVIALLYIDVRIRTEGLDVELAQAAQEA